MYFITGGARSGKSKYAMELALQLSPTPLYIATARRWDAEFEHRIQRHVADRGSSWVALEVEKDINAIKLNGSVAVLDCITLWLTNFFVDNNHDVDKTLKQTREQLDEFIKQESTIFIISNEIGMGVHAATEAGRKFTDLQGWINQYLAEKAERVILMVSGIPVTIK